MASFRRQIARGISWTGALRFVNRGLGIVKIAVLARLLTPEQFGEFGVGVLVLGFLELATETGVNVFLIQEKGSIDKYLDSAWVVSIVRGIAISAFLFLTTPLLVAFFASPGAYPILALISAVPAVRGFINPAIVRFQKNLEFHKEFLVESILVVVEVAAAIGIGLATRSAVALVAGMLVSAIFEVLISFAVVRPWPRLVFDRARLGKIVSRGKWLTAAGVFDYLFTHVDDLVVGKILGTGTLGLYQQAYKVATLPTIETEQVFNKVTFPAYTTVIEDKSKLRSAFVGMTAIITILVIVFGSFLIVFSRAAILIILGPTWLSAETVLRILVVYGVVRAILNSANSLLLAMNRQEIVSLVMFVSFLTLVITIVPLVLLYGASGAALSGILGVVSAIPFSVYFVRKAFVIK